jgi:hypothetical protein
MESVGQNATLFPKSQNSANLFFAQVHYLRELEKLVAKVSKVPIVTLGGGFWSCITHALSLTCKTRLGSSSPWHRWHATACSPMAGGLACCGARGFGLHGTPYRPLRGGAL